MNKINVNVEENYFYCECCGGSSNLNGDFIFNNKEYNLFYDGHLGKRYDNKMGETCINFNSSYHLPDAISETLFNLLKLIIRETNYKMLFYPLNYAKEYDYSACYYVDLTEEEQEKADLSEEELFNSFLSKNNLPNFDDVCNNDFVLIVNDNNVVYFDKEQEINSKKDCISSTTEMLLRTLNFLCYDVNINFKYND